MSTSIAKAETSLALAEARSRGRSSRQTREKQTKVVPAEAHLFAPGQSKPVATAQGVGSVKLTCPARSALHKGVPGGTRGERL